MLNTKANKAHQTNDTLNFCNMLIILFRCHNNSFSSTKRIHFNYIYSLNSIFNSRRFGVNVKIVYFKNGNWFYLYLHRSQWLYLPEETRLNSPFCYFVGDVFSSMSIFWPTYSTMLFSLFKHYLSICSAAV